MLLIGTIQGNCREISKGVGAQKGATWVVDGWNRR